MLATLALAAVLQPVPAQAEKLALKNDRITYGIYGQERKENKLLPGDMFFVSFDIEGLHVAEDGKVLYGMGMEIAGKDGKVVFKEQPKDLEVTNALGGSRVPAYARTAIGLDTAPGEYTLTVTVNDRTTKASEKLVRKYEVLPAKFGIVLLGLTSEGGNPVPPVAIPGQAIAVNLTLVGFELDDKRQPNVHVEMRIIDDATGKPTVAKPLVSEDIPNVGEEFKKHMPMQLFVFLNRPGKFTIEMKAVDRKSNKTAEEKLAIVVLDTK